jgi:putative membrane protein
MIGFIVRAVFAAAGLWIAAHVFHLVSYDTLTHLLIAALLLGLVNAIIRPILVVLTLPFTIITLGLFLLVINGLMILLVAHFVPGFHVHGQHGGLISAIVAAVIVSFTSWVGHAIVAPREERRW